MPLSFVKFVENQTASFVVRSYSFLDLAKEFRDELNEVVYPEVIKEFFSSQSGECLSRGCGKFDSLF